MKEATLNTPFTSGGIGPAGSGGIKKNDAIDTTMSSAPSIPSLSGVNAINDHNTCPQFSTPRSSGGIPVKFFENITATPEPLETTLEDTGLIR